MRSPHRCSSCGAEWYNTHTCPNLPSITTAPILPKEAQITLATKPNPPVFCIHCGKMQDWHTATWSMGPLSQKVHFVCSCGWHVKAEALAPEFFLQQLEADERMAE